MANYIKTLQETNAEQAERISLADDSLQAFRAYLASPKFTGESELQGYISIQDVEQRLGEIWRHLHGIN